MTAPTPTPPPADVHRHARSAAFVVAKWCGSRKLYPIYDQAESLLAALTEAGYAITPRQAGVTIPLDDLEALVEDVHAVDYAGYFDDHPVMTRIETLIAPDAAEDGA